MTTHADDHPSDEALSSHLDAVAGEPLAWPEAGAGAAVTEHVAQCPPCQWRLARLDQVRSAVAAVGPPPPEGTREAAVALVLAQAEAPPRPPVPAGDGADRHGGRRELRPVWWQRPAARWLGAAAAAVAVAGIATGITLASGPGGTPTATRAASGASGLRVRGEAPSSSRAGPAIRSLAPPAAGARDLGSLGRVAGRAALDQQIRGSVKARGGPATSTSASSAAPSAGVTRAARPSRVCASEAQGRQPSGWHLAYWATATYAGTPARVFAYRGPATGSGSRASGPLRVEVLAASGCRLLLASTVTP